MNYQCCWHLPAADGDGCTTDYHNVSEWSHELYPFICTVLSQTCHFDSWKLGVCVTLSKSFYHWTHPFTETRCGKPVVKSCLLVSFGYIKQSNYNQVTCMYCGFWCWCGWICADEGLTLDQMFRFSIYVTMGSMWCFEGLVILLLDILTFLYS